MPSISIENLSCVTEESSASSSVVTLASGRLRSMAAVSRRSMGRSWSSGASLRTMSQYADDSDWADG